MHECKSSLQAAREIRETETEGESFRKPPVDVQLASLPELHEDLTLDDLYEKIRMMGKCQLGEIPNLVRPET